MPRCPECGEFFMADVELDEHGFDKHGWYPPPEDEEQE